MTNYILTNYIFDEFKILILLLFYISKIKIPTTLIISSRSKIGVVNVALEMASYAFWAIFGTCSFTVVFWLVYHCFLVNFCNESTSESSSCNSSSKKLQTGCNKFIINETSWTMMSHDSSDMRLQNSYSERRGWIH